MTVINLGSINIDHVYQVPHFVNPGETLASTSYIKVLGGKGANQSIALAHAGAQVKHVGLVNEEDCSIKQHLIRKNIDCKYLKMSEEPTGHAIIQVNESGENAIVLFAGANHDVTPQLTRQAFADTEQGDWMLTQNETNCIGESMEEAKRNGLKIAFNPAPMNASVLQLPLHLVDLFIVNEIEAAGIAGTESMPDIEAFFSEKFPDAEVIITLGKQGAVMLTKSGKITVPAFEVEAVDTTAAGDTFIGFFLSSYIKNTDPEQALINACAASAIAVTRPGAAQSIPDQEEVQAFLKQQKQ
ncbi:ribokinase [Paraneptunicella aestuarii]|uniref:ribokinase n=1 Tax=Paraneptunicella aestuarii TaxID=2831148 RepID=UPI001E5CC7DA|nr:ribokinase [Paraneptunicella aestuarii]UAA39846.1 ribokinase [Paraneptunicella aestuarii]